MALLSISLSLARVAEIRGSGAVLTKLLLLSFRR